MDKVLLKYTEYNEPHESLTNRNVIEALNKKEHKNGGLSPESPEPEDFLAPRSADPKYSKIEEEYHVLMQRSSQLNGNRVGLSLSSYQMGGGGSGGGPAPGGGGAGGASSVPVNSPYGTGSDGGAPLMQPSPQMQHSLSPRPGSSQGLLDMSNGYPNSTSPLPGATSPNMFHKAAHGLKAQHSPTAPTAIMARGGNSGGGGAMAAGGAIPHSLSYPAAFGGQDFASAELQMSSLNSLHPWSVGIGSSSAHSGLHHNVPHVSVSSSSPPPQHGGSPSPLRIIKSEPVSPPRDGHTPNGLQHLRPSSTGHLSPGHGHGHGHGHPAHMPAQSTIHPGGHLTPTNTHHSHSSPEPSLSDYESGPLQKRPRVADPWAT